MMDKLSNPLSKLVDRNQRKPKKNLLQRRLEDALEQGDSIWIETSSDSYEGIPIHMDEEFVELLVLATDDNDLGLVADDEEEESLLGDLLLLDEEGCKRTSWLIRLSSIMAIAYPTENWSKERLENLLRNDEAEESETEEDLDT